MSASADLGDLLALLQSLLDFFDDAHDVGASTGCCAHKVASRREHQLHDLGLCLVACWECTQAFDAGVAFEVFAVEASALEFKFLDLFGPVDQFTGYIDNRVGAVAQRGRADQCRARTCGGQTAVGALGT